MQEDHNYRNRANANQDADSTEGPQHNADHLPTTPQQYQVKNQHIKKSWPSDQLKLPNVAKLGNKDLSPCMEREQNLEESQAIPTQPEQDHPYQYGPVDSNVFESFEVPLKASNKHKKPQNAFTEKTGELTPLLRGDEDQRSVAESTIKTKNHPRLYVPIESNEQILRNSQGGEGNSLDSQVETALHNASKLAKKMLLPGSNFTVEQELSEKVKKNNNESSSNYEASIFEDEDGDTSSDNMDDSDKAVNAKTKDAADMDDGEDVSPTRNGDGGNVGQGDTFGTKADRTVNESSGVKRKDATGQPKSIKKQVKLTSENELEPMPLIKSGVSIAADMRFGWKPQQKEVHGAPIPLHYDFETNEIPINPVTNKPFTVLYHGPRIETSIAVHKKFANIDNMSKDQCPDPRPKDKKHEPLSSYQFKFPEKTPLMLPHSFDEQPPFVGMNPQMPNKDDQLVFNSAFESGNLDMVIQTKPMTYDLYMRVDTNTRGHHQWFYFSVEVPPALQKSTVTFRVVNFTKPQSLYTSGMRICLAKKSSNYAWTKGGHDIKYGKSHLIRRHSSDPTKVIHYSMLTFSLDFEKTKEREKIFFAYCFPYSFSMLQRFLKEISLNYAHCDYFKESVICKSLSGIDVPLITISSRLLADPKHYNQIKLSEFEDDDSKLSLPMYKKKKYAIITARVHPGESNSSYMMQGFIKYLLGDSHQAKQLRKRVVFKIVPMINTDGVIIGNYRTSMSGNDLNRRYVRPDFRIHPVVAGIKQLASDLVIGRDSDEAKKQNEPVTANEDILCFVDMHGHSRKKNVFVYGPQEPLHSDKYLKMRIIPKLLAEETQKFRYHSCKFRLEQSKLKAARIVMWREFNIMNCFTFEASFHGHFDRVNNNFEFTTQQYEEMGEHLANSLFEYLMIIEEEERRHKLKEIQKKKKKKQKQLAMQRATQLVKDNAAVSAINSNGNSVIGSVASIAHQSYSKDANNAIGSSNYLNLPPSGKSGKKASGGGGSSSSRARNVSHATNKDSDKEIGSAGKKATTQSKTEKNTATKQKEKKDKKITLVKSHTPSNHNVTATDQSRNVAITTQSVRRGARVANNPNEPPGSETNVSAGSEADRRSTEGPEFQQ